MEYEIADDPQGLPDRPEGDRDGGVREGRTIFHKESSARPSHRNAEAPGEDMPLQQLGELV